MKNLLFVVALLPYVLCAQSNFKPIDEHTSGLPNANEKKKIIAATKAFSKAYMDGDFETIANSYTMDAKIFPNNADIISGRKAVKERWMLGAETKILHHEIIPLEITFLGEYAHDYGYFEGKSENKDGSISNWRGKYVVVWKKEDGNWKMYLDIWNRIRD
jgi:ketosteroid isomerase-like protein